MDGTKHTLEVMLKTAVKSARLHNAAAVTMEKIERPGEAMIYRMTRDSDMRKARALRSAIKRMFHA